MQVSILESICMVIGYLSPGGLGLLHTWTWQLLKVPVHKQPSGRINLQIRTPYEELCSQRSEMFHIPPLEP